MKFGENSIIFIKWLAGSHGFLYHKPRYATGFDVMTINLLYLLYKYKWQSEANMKEEPICFAIRFRLFDGIDTFEGKNG
jgi:hypothetical protein